MIPNWTAHLRDPEEKKRFWAYLKNSRGLLDRLSDIIREMEEDLTQKELSMDTYDSPAWAAKQADINGSRRTIRAIQKLITLDPKEKHG